MKKLIVCIEIMRVFSRKKTIEYAFPIRSFHLQNRHILFKIINFVKLCIECFSIYKINMFFYNQTKHNNIMNWKNILNFYIYIQNYMYVKMHFFINMLYSVIHQNLIFWL